MRPILLGFLLILLAGCPLRQPDAPVPPPPSSAIVQADAQATHVADLGKRIEAEKVAAIESTSAAEAAAKAGDTKAADEAKAEAAKHAALAKLFEEIRDKDKAELEALKKQVKKEAEEKAEADKKEAAAVALQASIDRVRTYGLLAAGVGSLIALAGGLAAWYYPMMRGIFTVVAVFGAGLIALGTTAAMLAPALAYSELVSKVGLGLAGAVVLGLGTVGARFVWLHHAAQGALADFGHRVEELVPDKAALKALKDEAKAAPGAAQKLVAQVVAKSKDRLKLKP